MSFTRSTEAALTARQTRQLTKKFTAQLTERERGADRAVRRHSYDVDDSRAQVFRPIGDGTKRGAMGWIDCLLQVAREYDDQHRDDGGKRPLGWTGLAVLEVLLGRRGRRRIPIDFKTGRLDPAIDTIAEATGLVRVTVVRALARLKATGFLQWVRRSRRTGNDGLFAPQRKQTSNAYFFDLGQLPKNVLQRFRDLLGRKQRAQAAATDRAVESPTEAPANHAEPQDSGLRAAIRSLSCSLSASTPSSPAIPVQG